MQQNMALQTLIKFLYTICIVFILTVNIQAQSLNVTLEEARQVAINKLYSENLSLRSTASLEVKNFGVHFMNSDTILYYFNFEPQGFVLVSADKSYQPVIAYSTVNYFTIDNRITNFGQYMEGIAEEMKLLKKLEKYSFESEWNRFLDINFERKDLSAVRNGKVDSILLTKWDQTEYYNDLFPEDKEAPKNYNNRVPVGCLNVAAGQVMNFFRHPLQGKGTVRYIDGNYNLNVNIDLSTQAYNWDNLPSKLVSPNADVSELLYHLALATETKFESTVSLTYADKAAAALETNFDYDVKVLQATSYSHKEWLDKLKDQLRAGKPFIYRGAKIISSYGHAWVCDGFKEVGDDTELHMNWGWGGKNDGFYLVRNYYLIFENYNIEVINGYNANIAIFIEPKTAPAINVKASKGTFTNKVRISWDKPLVRPGNYFQVFRSLEDNPITALPISKWTKDITYFDDLDGNSQTVYYYWVGSASHLVLNAVDGKLYGENGSLSSQSDTGYKSLPAGTVCGNTTLTSVSGTFSDGSPDNQNYSNNTRCTWHIKPDNGNMRFIHIKYSSFDTEKDHDVLNVYKGYDRYGQKLASYSGNYIPEDINVEASEVFIEFITDESINRKGWRAIYTSSAYPISGLNNDEPCGAIRLPFQTFPLYVSGTNVGATTTQHPTPGYFGGDFSESDVWFVTTVPPRSEFEIVMKSGDLKDAVAVLSSGYDCVRFNDENIWDNGIYGGQKNDVYWSQSQNGMPRIGALVERWVTEPLDAYIRVFGQNGKTGTFEIAVIDKGRYFQDEEILENRTQESNISLSRTDKKNLDVQLAPNPAYDKIHLNVQKNKNEDIEIKILDLAGKEYYKNNTRLNELEINTMDWPAGVYMLSVLGSSAQQTEKLIISK
jgi:hypothetical protein